MWLVKLSLVALALALAPMSATSLTHGGAQSEELQALIEKRGIESIKDATKDIKSRDAEKRIEAVKTLTGVKRPEAVAILITALGDADARVRRQSAYTLDSLGDAAEPARAALMNALGDPQADVVADAAETLHRAFRVSDKELAPARLRVLDTKHVGAPFDVARTRFYAARGLIGLAQADRLIEPLMAYLDEQARGTTREAMMRDLQGHSAREANVEIARAALGHIVEETRDRALIPPLLKAARAARRETAAYLKALALFDPLPDGWTTLLVERLSTSDVDALPDILSLLGDTAVSAESVAAWAPAAARFEKDPEPRVRAALISALRRVRGLASDQIDIPLRALATEKDSRARGSLLGVIEAIGDRTQATSGAGKRLVAERAVPVLVRVINEDPDRGVREDAARTLVSLQLDPAEMMKVLTPFTAATYPEGVRRSVNRALDGLKKSVPPAPLVVEGNKAAPAPAPDRVAEARALEFLRSRNAQFEPDSINTALVGQIDLELLRAYLDAGLSPNGPAKQGAMPPLYMAIAFGLCEVGVRPSPAPLKEAMKLLLARGADVNLPDSMGTTSLMKAAEGCDRETISILLKAGAKVDTKNATGMTAFEFGLFRGNEGVEELIAAGYRLPADKIAGLREGYASNPKALELIRRATPAAK